MIINDSGRVWKIKREYLWRFPIKTDFSGQNHGLEGQKRNLTACFLKNLVIVQQHSIIPLLRQRDGQLPVLTVCQYQEALLIAPPVKGVEIIFLPEDGLKAAVYDCIGVKRILAQRDQSFVKLQDRIRIPFFGGSVDFPEIGFT